MKLRLRYIGGDPVYRLYLVFTEIPEIVKKIDRIFKQRKELSQLIAEAVIMTVYIRL